MKWIDYREKLGIGFADKVKYDYFLTRVFNFFIVCRNTEFGLVDLDTYLKFCDLTGTKVEPGLIDDGCEGRRFDFFWYILEKSKTNYAEFLSYYVPFMNSVKEESSGLRKSMLKDTILSALSDARLPFDLVEDMDGYFIFPKGVIEMDDALVSSILYWLNDYPLSEKAWSKALRAYSQHDTGSASDVADKFRKALETFFKEFFGNDKTLENNKAEYGRYLKSQGVPAEISNNLETLLQAYTHFMNGYAKHHDKTETKVLEYLMYQTGNIMRLLITLKAEAESNAD